MDQLLQDIRFGLRQLVKHPVFTLVSALALGLGIGGVTTQLSVVNGLFFRGLPFPSASEIHHLERINVESEDFGVEVPPYEFLEWRRQQDGFTELCAWYSGTANLTVDGQVQRYDGCFISANSFTELRVNAFLGRTLQAGDDLPESPEVLVLSHRVWTRDFGADPDIIGRPATLNGRNVTIVGVMGPDFGFPVNEDLWSPLFKQSAMTSLSWGDDAVSLEVFGRLRPGVSRDQAHASMALVARNLEAAHPETNKGFRDIMVHPFVEEFLGKEVTGLASVMLLITFLILLIACANVANLLLARSMRRQKEIAIRSALGASRPRILSQFLTESVLLAFIGAMLGILCSLYSLRDIIRTTTEMNTPFWMDFHLDWKVLVVVIMVTVLTGILSGLVPALRASRCNESEVLKDDSRTSSSLQMGLFSKALVLIQISLAAIILTLVFLLTRSMGNAMAMHYHYDADELVTARIGLFEESYPDEQSRANFANALLRSLRDHPDIAWAGTSSRYGFAGSGQTVYELPGEVYTSDTDRHLAYYQLVSEDFFSGVGLPLLAGRDFNPEDYTVDYPRFAIVNKAFADRKWKGSSPLGRRFRPQLPGWDLDQEELPLVEVVGVAAPMNEAGPMPDRDQDGAAFFLPQTTGTFPGFVTVMARGRVPSSDLLEVMRSEVAKLDSNLPLYMTGSPREINDQQMVQFRFFQSVFTSFGILATFLASIGIYGVITFSVNQRLMEFGIRQALGSTRAGIFKLVYRHALSQLGFGFLVAFLLLTPLMFSSGLRDSLTIFFYGIDPESLVPYAFSFGFVALISLLSAAPPAIRAARTEPAQALRYE